MGPCFSHQVWNLFGDFRIAFGTTFLGIDVKRFRLTHLCFVKYRSHFGSNLVQDQIISVLLVCPCAMSAHPWAAHRHSWQRLSHPSVPDPSAEDPYSYNPLFLLTERIEAMSLSGTCSISSVSRDSWQ